MEGHLWGGRITDAACKLLCFDCTACFWARCERMRVRRPACITSSSKEHHHVNPHHLGSLAACVPVQPKCAYMPAARWRTRSLCICCIYTDTAFSSGQVAVLYKHRSFMQHASHGRTWCTGQHGSRFHRPRIYITNQCSARRHHVYVESMIRWERCHLGPRLGTDATGRELPFCWQPHSNGLWREADCKLAQVWQPCGMI